MATSEYVDPRVKLQEAKGMLTFMDTDGDGQVCNELMMHPLSSESVVCTSADHELVCRFRSKSSGRPCCTCSRT